jgi:photosystem II stability/assembly factor-like uncharacterized protein
LDGEPPKGLTPVELSADGSAFVTLDDSGRLARWPVDELPWQPAALPSIDQIAFDRLIPSPDFGRDRTMVAVSEGAGIVRSDDAGLTWADTRFPLRITAGETPRPLILSSGDLLVGTVLGLYRLEGNGPWTPVGGGLPSGIPVSNPSLGNDGALHLVVGSGEIGSVYVSTDGGETWTVAIESLPAGATAGDLLLSPAVATDRTAFYAPSYGKPQRTLDGSTWEEFGPPGDWQFSIVQISPAFDRDGLIIARLGDDSLWRSTDRGDTWANIDGPWSGGAPYAVTISDDYRLRAVTFSPTFGQDGMLLTLAGNAIYRSPDRGDTWTKVLDLKPGLSQAVFSPDYAGDGTIYLLQGNTLYRSKDRGQTWKALPAAPWDASDEIHLAISPTFPDDRVLCVWTLSGRVYESTNGGQSWRETSNGLAGRTIRQVLFSPSHATDGLLFLMPYNTGLLKQVSGGTWLPITERAPAPQPTPTQPVPTPAPTPRSPAAAPTAVPTPVVCAIRPVKFQSVWQQMGVRLGCPEETAAQIPFAEQLFEHGRMFWDSSTRKIYVLLEDGTWSVFDDTFDENTDPAYDPNLPPPPRQPQRGFGKVWREQLGGPQAAIGWAVANEKSVDAWRQRFDGGLLIWSDVDQTSGAGWGTAYLLYNDGTWQPVAAAQP